MTTSTPRGRVQAHGLPPGHAAARQGAGGVLEGRRASFAERTGRLLVGRWVLDKAGLLRVRYAGVGGGPVVRDLLEWYWRLGVPLHEQYGQVEAGGIAFAQRGIEDAGTAGMPLGPEIEARVVPAASCTFARPVCSSGGSAPPVPSSSTAGWRPATSPRSTRRGGW